MDVHAVTTFIRSSEIFCCVQYFSPPVQSQECVQNLPVFEDQGGGGGIERLEGGSTGTQTIIPDYSFDCYGNVTQWGAYVERGGPRESYTLDFQVWRRSGGGQGTTGEYDFVGSNHFSSISAAGRSGGRIWTELVPVEEQIQVLPGDVIGVYLRGRGNNDDDGVELHTNSPDVTVWFITTSAAVSTRIEVGSTASPGLHSSTTGAPVITAMVVPSTPPPSTPFPSQPPSPSPTPSPSFPDSIHENVPATVTSTVQSPPLMISQNVNSASSTPQPSSFLPSPGTISPPVVGSGLPVGVIVAIVIVVLIVSVPGVLILVFILALVWRRSSKKQVLMVKSFNNPEYSGKFEIMH